MFPVTILALFGKGQLSIKGRAFSAAILSTERQKLFYNKNLVELPGEMCTCDRNNVLIIYIFYLSEVARGIDFDVFVSYCI